ncbi:MAG: hypothetical protein DRQ88_01485 [Epsilonproteobacteria bacterium]|nr:MAG: hypothetical protein DRQ89_03045 [Campylobacterota bacterium]RLA67749.1 MAG: hypothetical protein DRQ88_01485 [Campylobacterota bacterium]
MKIKFLALIIGIFSLISPTTFAFFGGNSAAFTDEALFLDINKDGFEALGDIAQDQLLGNLQDQAMEDINLDIPLIAKIKVKNISFSAKFEKIEIIPEKDGLDVRLAIRDLSIKIGEVRVSNWFLPGMGTSCFNTKITLGDGNLIPIRARLGLRLKNGSVQFRDRGTKLHLNSRQYVTSGPTSCKGMFGVTDAITEFVVRNVIAMARPAINAGVKLGVNVLSSKIGDLLFTQLDKVRIPLTIPNILITPETKILMGIRINDLKITKDKMRLILGVAVEKNYNKGMVETELPELLSYGTLGLNPVFINKLIATVMPEEGTNPVEITPDFHEMLKEMLRTSEFANFIPDLDEVETDTDELKMFLTFLKPPKLALKDNSLDMSLKDVELKLKIKKDGTWIDYFFINLGTDLNVKGEISDGKLKLFPELSSFDVDGQFADNYTPINNTFLADDLKETLEVILEIFTEGEEGLAIDIPLFTLGTRQIGFDKLEIKAPYLFLDLVGRNLAQ